MKKLPIFIFLFFVFSFSKVSAATLTFEPSEISNASIGEIKKINVVLDPQGKLVSGVEAYITSSSVNAEITNIEKSTALSSQDYQFTSFDSNKASFSVFKPSGSSSISTKITLAILSVKIVKAGSAELSFVNSGSSYSTIMEDTTWAELLTSTGKFTISTSSSSSSDNNDDDNSDDSDSDSDSNSDSNSDSDSNVGGTNSPEITSTPIYRSSSTVPGTGSLDITIFFAISTLLISSSIVVKKYFV